MNFATSTLTADGRAALALVVALIQHLEKDGKIIPKDRKEIIAAARQLIPGGPERNNEEAVKILGALSI
jgi:hypothetical protein